MQKNTAPRRSAGTNAHANAARRPSGASTRQPVRAAQKTSSTPSVSGGAKIAIIIAVAVLFIIGSYFLQKSFPNGFGRTDEGTKITTIDAADTVRITEVMSSNSSAIQDDTGDYADWIEVTNISNESVNLHGWKIAEDSSAVLKLFKFPNHTLAPGESTIVFCTSKSANAYGYAYHAPFRISAAGDTLVLMNPQDIVRQTLNVPEMSSNQSYAEINGEWVVTYEYTPLMANTSANHALMKDNRSIVEDAIEITELMAKNITYAPDENGEYLDWIEIHNKSAYSVSLNGYGLSDSEDNLQKWKFPNISLGAGEYMIVYASGYDRKDTSSNLHTSFKLNTEKERVILTNAKGQPVDIVEYDLLKADQSYSKQADGSWTIMLPPTPSKANNNSSAALIDDRFAAQNSSGVFINEVMASTTTVISGGASYDWAEIRNVTSSTIDLSGWGLSDEAEAPRKWQFPDGTTIAPNALLGVMFTGVEKNEGSSLEANFKLSASSGEMLTLSYPDGTIVDRVYLGAQRANVSYGRVSGKSGFYYMTPTPLSSNITDPQYYRQSLLQSPTFSVSGGLYPAGSSFTVELTADAGATIYYTLDSSTPSADALGGKSFTLDPRLEGSGISDKYITYKYTGPIEISETTVLRAIAVRDDALDSLVATQTYFVGVNHTMEVVSLVMHPADLWDYNKGIYVYGPNAFASSPYGSINRGANFWMTWEKDANVEVYLTDGTTLISQGCGVQLQGQFSRKEAQKSFKVIARSKYGENRFNAKLFENRDYTEYQSFVLRSSGQDWDKTRFRDSILTSLAEGTSVMYQDTTLTIVYLNGMYWGHYNMRERINTFSICQWEGWDESIKDDIDLIKANTERWKGSTDEWIKIRDWVKKNGIGTKEKLEYVEQFIDVDNYLEYVGVQMFIGNTDLLNVKKYRSDSTDGKWRWILFDTDWAFITNTNSVGRWLTPGGVGTDNKTDNNLFVELMKNPIARDRFLRMFAEKLATIWSTESVVQKAEERLALLTPELEQHLERWNITQDKYKREYNSFVSYAKNRPGRLLYCFAQVLSKQDMQTYFGEILKTVPMLDENYKVWNFK